MALGAQLRARIHFASVPLLAGVEQLAADGFVTGASARNWAGYQHDVQLDAAITPLQQALLCDPQTSGGLLVACAQDAVDTVLAVFHAQGFAHAALIGEMSQGTPGVEVVSG